MKQYLPLRLSFRHALSFVCLLTVLVLSACATRAKFTESTVVPGAEGTVKVKKDNNGNYAIDIEISNIAPANKLAQPKDVYVVWAETGNGLKNLGRLDVDKGFISGKLKASMETSIPYKPTRIFITGEESGSISYPSSFVVLNTNSF